MYVSVFISENNTQSATNSMTGFTPTLQSGKSSNSMLSEVPIAILAFSFFDFGDKLA